MVDRRWLSTTPPLVPGGLMIIPAGPLNKTRGLIAALAAALFVFVSPQAALAQPALWTVRDADSTIYLLGTIHLLRPDTAWRTGRLEAAMGEAGELWLELPTTDPEAMRGDMVQLVSRYGLSPAQPLLKDLTPEESRTLNEAAGLAGLTASQLNPFRPWFAALTISTAAVTHAGYDPASGVDTRIESMFRARAITPKGLESAGEQIAIFAGMSREEELAYLRQTMNEYENAPRELDEMVRWWSAGQTDRLETLMIDDMKATTPSLYETLLVNRNRRWAEKIEDILKGKGVVFIAVGTAHLVGPDSVLAILRARGVSSQRIQ